MSANNHDNGDPNNVRYAPKVPQSRLDALMEIDENEDNLELMQMFIMAKSMKFSEWKAWAEKSGYIIHVKL